MTKNNELIRVGKEAEKKELTGNETLREIIKKFQKERALTKTSREE